MREIKFRYWNEQASRYHYGQAQVLTCLSQQTTGMYDHESDGCRFEQFTGLHDKNGKEIYEGDVLLFDDSEYGGEKEYFVVSFEKHSYDSGVYPFMGFGLKPIDAPDLDRHCKMFNKDEFSICGNIHENPELLNAR